MITQVNRPKIKDLKRLAYEINSFPISDLEIIQFAEHHGYGDELINFLKLFYRAMVFHSRTEFLNYCNFLELILREREQSAPELLRSPQD